MIDQLLRRVRFLNDPGHVGLTKPLDCFHLVVTAADHDRDVGPDFLDERQRLFTTHHRHHHIQEHERDLVRHFLKHLDGDLPVFGGPHFETILRQRSQRCAPDDRLILHNQNCGLSVHALRRARRRSSRRSRFRHREQDAEHTALPRRARHLDRAAVRPNYTEHSREPQSPSRRFSGEEGIENMGPGLLVHTGSFVPDLDVNISPLGDNVSSNEIPRRLRLEIGDARRDRHGSARVADCFRPVGDQVQRHLPDLRRIGLDERNVSIELHPELHLLRDRGLREPGQVRDQLRQIDRVGHETAGLAGEGQELS